MKAFFVGLIFLCAVMAAAGLSMLLFPLLVVLSLLLRIVLGVALFIAVVWALGKCIIWVGEKFFPASTKKRVR